MRACFAALPTVSTSVIVTMPEGFNESAIIFLGGIVSLLYKGRVSAFLFGTVSTITVNKFGNLFLHLLLASKGYVIKTNTPKKTPAAFIFAYSLK